MFIRLIIVFIILIGMVPGHYAIEDNTGIKPNYDGMWKDYEYNSESTIEKILGEQGARAMWYAVAQIAHIGVEMAGMFYPYGMVIGVAIAILALTGLGIFMYPILFIYVLLDERKIKKQNHNE